MITVCTVCTERSPTLKASQKESVAIGLMAGQSASAGSTAAELEVAPTLRSSSSGTNQAPTVVAMMGNVIDRQALDYAIKALKGPTREQVEALPKCDYCEAEWGTCDPITNRFTMPPRGGIRFCPMCGRPITDEAVDIIMQRLEELKEK